MNLSEATFELAESSPFSGQWSWRLKNNLIRTRFKPVDRKEHPGVHPVTVNIEQIQRLIPALDFLDVWDWRDGYDPAECDAIVCDGMKWSFKAVMPDRVCVASGINAYPSFADSKCSSLDPERYEFLIYTLQSVLGITVPE